MEKYNALRDILIEILPLDVAHRSIIVMLQRDLSQLHSIEGKFDEVILSLWSYALAAQKVQLPDLVYIRLVGSILEFERECKQLQNHCSSSLVVQEVKPRHKRRSAKSLRSQQ